MTPEGRAWAVCEAMDGPLRRMGVTTTAHYDAGVPLIAAAVRAAVAEEREACVSLIRQYLLFNDQRAVSWHEVMDCIDAIRSREE
jgi:hypothetical protein